MKRFACGDVVPGCTAEWTAETDEELLARVATHAAEDHHVTEVTPELVDAVRSKITPIG